jgi:hypothetical protein
LGSPFATQGRLALDQAEFVAVYVFELRPHPPRLLVGFLAELDPAPHSSSQVAPRSSHSKTTFAKVPIRL